MTKPRVELYAYVFAAKRYCLYVPPDKIVKVSKHTLGIVQPPRDKNGSAIRDWIEQFVRHIVTGRYFSPAWAAQQVEFQLSISRPDIRRSFQGLRAGNAVETGNKYMNRYLSSIKPFSTVAVLRKSEDKFSMSRLESEQLEDVPVISPVRLDGQTASRCWVAKDSGRPVSILPPEEATHPAPGISDEDVEKQAAVRWEERQAAIQEAERDGGLFTTGMTFEELMADYQRQHENKALDAYGVEAAPETRGLLFHPRVKITELYFTGKETVLQEEVEQGIVSAEEAENNRFLIGPERDSATELVIQALRFLSKTELRHLKIGWRTAAKIKEGQGVSIKDPPRLLMELVEFLQAQYPEEVDNLEGEDTLRAFVDNRKRLFERWQAVQPRLAEVRTKELAEMAGCSSREAIRIKKGRVEPSIQTMGRLIKRYG